MKSRISKASYLVGAALASALFAASAKAHECRTLGQVSDFGTPATPVYRICVGFAVEDGDRPRAGTKNNLDFFPLLLTGPDPSQIFPLDTRTGATVSFKAKLGKLHLL